MPAFQKDYQAMQPSVRISS